MPCAHCCGLLQPKMNYEKGLCDFECNLCGQVCPTAAISPLAHEEKKRTQIGRADLDKKLCIVHTKKRHCGACGEVCPTHAIVAAPKNRVLFPKMIPEYCIGCGACQRACPTNPKAVFVTANPIHVRAEKYIPKPLSLPSGDKESDAFPF